MSYHNNDKSENSGFLILLALSPSILILALFILTSVQHLGSGDKMMPEFIPGVITEDTYLASNYEGHGLIKLNKGDRVTVMASAKDEKYYWIESEDGKRGMVSSYNVECQTPKFEVNLKNGRYRIPGEEFRDLCLGKSFYELDDKYRMALFVKEVPKKGNTVEIPFHYHLFWENWSCSEPTVVYVDGIASEIKYKKVRHLNRFPLNIMPFSEKIFNNVHIQKIASKPFLKKHKDNNEHKIVTVIKEVIRLAGIALYIIFIPFVPVLIIILLLFWPASLKFMSNKALYITFIIIGTACAYLWFVICLIEGYFFLWMFFAGLISLSLNLLCGIGITSMRCDNCKHLFMNQLTRSILKDRYESRVEYWEKEYHTTSKNVKGTITTKTIRQYDNHLISSSSREGTIAKDITTSIVHNKIEEIYDVKEYDNTYRCSNCGYIVNKNESTEDLISKKVIDKKFDINTYRKYKYPTEE